MSLAIVAALGRVRKKPPESKIALRLDAPKWTRKFHPGPRGTCRRGHAPGLRVACYDQAMEDRDERDHPLGEGVDRTLIRAMLRLTPAQRVSRLKKEARFFRLLRAARIAAAHRPTAGPPEPRH